MKAQYDFSKAKRSTYAGKLTKAVALSLDEATFDYFKSMAAEMDVPVQALINVYLRDCARSERKPSIKGTWELAAD